MHGLFEAAQQRIAVITTTKQSLGEQFKDFETALHAAKAELAGASRERLDIANEWTKREAEIVIEKTFMAKTLNELRPNDAQNRKSLFQVTATDSDGRFSFRLPKAGSYLFLAFGQRQLFGRVEKHFWVRKDRIAKRQIYTCDFDLAWAGAIGGCGDSRPIVAGRVYVLSQNRQPAGLAGITVLEFDERAPDGESSGSQFRAEKQMAAHSSSVNRSTNRLSRAVSKVLRGLPLPRRVSFIEFCNFQARIIQEFSGTK